MMDLWEIELCHRLESATLEELAIALTSSNELERWYAQFCLTKLLGLQGVSDVGE